MLQIESTPFTYWMTSLIGIWCQIHEVFKAPLFSRCPTLYCSTRVMKYFNMAADDKGADPEIGGQLRRLEVVGIDSKENKAWKYLWSHICKIVVSWCVGPVLDAPRQWRGWNMCHICFARRRPYAGEFFEIHHREKVGRLLILFKLQMILVQKKVQNQLLLPLRSLVSEVTFDFYLFSFS